MLLHEVLATNPFTGNSQKPWDVIAEAMKTYMPDVSSRCYRERCLLLMKMFRENDRANLRKSGTEEQYDEKEQLLQEILELEEERRVMQTALATNKKRQARDENEIVHRIRSAAMTSMSTPSTSESTSMSGDEGDQQRPVKKCTSNDKVIQLVTESLEKSKTKMRN